MSLKDLFLASTLLLPSAALANDTAFAGEGANLIPITNADVRMVDEHVVLEGQLYEGHLDAWKVTVTFHFKNESDKPTTLKMGFPFPELYRECNPNDSDCNDSPMSVPHGRDFNKALIYDFKATLRGQEIKTTETALDASYAADPEHPYKYAYTWDAEIAAGEEIEVVNSYLTGITSNSSRQEFADYVVKTGKNWKGGKIGRSWIEIKPNMPFRTCDEAKKDEAASHPKPAGYALKGEGKDRKIEWDLKDFAPESDVHVCFYTRQGFIEQLMWSYEYEQALESMSAADLRIARNQVFAYFGYVFTSPDLKDYFAKQWWYEPDPSFKPETLPDDMKNRIQKIKALELKKAKSK